MSTMYIILLVLSLATGCSSKYTTIKSIEDEKLQEQKSKIEISYSSGFTVYIDRSDRIKYICKNKSLYNYSDGECGYYDKSKHSYDNLIVQEEVFGTSKAGYDPLRMPNNLKCGTGSVYGWLAILMMDPYAIKDYTSKDKEGCGYRYTKLDDTLILERTIGGIYTFGTSFITGANLHTREFDKEAFIDSVHNSRIDSYKDEIYRAVEGYNIDGGFNIIYLEKGHYESDLEEAYRTLLTGKTKKAGILLLDYDSKNLISIVVFDKYKDMELISSLSLQIGDILEVKNNKNLNKLKYNDIIKRLPVEINLPKIPASPKLIQSEYETFSSFQKRVQDAEQERKATIESLQAQYSLKVANRNAHIIQLQHQFKEYLKDMSINRDETIKELQGAIPSLARLLFLGNLSGYIANKFNYNAETQHLFFTIDSAKKGYSQDVVATVSPSSARNIKDSSSFMLLPEITYKDSTLQLKSFKIVDTIDNDSYNVSYTDINYIPKRASVRIVSEKESIDKKVSVAFKNAIQIEKSIADANREIWYVDGMSREGGEAPEWTIGITQTSELISLGTGDTLIEASKNSRDDLSMKIHVKIGNSLESREIVTNFKTDTKLIYTSKHSSEIELTSNDYEVYRQSKKNGRWYVALRYLK